jgi:YHS domain-containing protein
MGNLVEFAKHIKEQLAAANCEAHWAPGEAERYMEDVSERRHRFEELAAQLNESVIQPRLASLASYFVNANLTQDQPAGHSECWFGYCERFPSSTKVAFGVEHDVRFEKTAVCYEVSMMPLFIRFNEHDRMTAELDEVNEDQVADWVEERILEFLDAYMRIDRGGDDFEDESVTDPVCGMRISRSTAFASDSYFGHPYFFCSKMCLEKFEQYPEHYAQIRTM